QLLTRAQRRAEDDYVLHYAAETTVRKARDQTDSEPRPDAAAGGNLRSVPGFASADRSTAAGESLVDQQRRVPGRPSATAGLSDQPSGAERRAEGESGLLHAAGATVRKGREQGQSQPRPDAAAGGNLRSVPGFASTDQPRAEE